MAISAICKKYMHITILFPSEESFYRRMGMELYENFPSYEEFFTKLNKASRINWKDVLIYENVPYNWDVVSKKVAVLLTSIAYFRLWKETYKQDCMQFIGNGIGYLSALVCEGILKETDAIAMIQNKSVKEKAVGTGVTSQTYCVSKGRMPESRQDILEEMKYVLWNAKEPSEFGEIVKGLNTESVLEIGPDNKTLKGLKGKHNQVLAWFDRQGDNSYVLENIQLKKFFNRQYGVRKILANITSTQNYNPEEGAQEIVMKCYTEVRRVLDTSVQRGTNEISEAEWNQCIQSLKENFAAKKVGQDEIEARYQHLEEETLLKFCEIGK